MATHFLPLSKNVSCTSTPQGKHVCQISWELVKNWGSSLRRKIFFPIFAIICHYHGNTFCHCRKNVSCTSTPQGRHLCQISWELVKYWGSSSRRKIFPPIFAIICRYHGNTFCHCRKMCLAHLHPKANICAKFHENWWNTEEVVRDAKFSPHFCHNMPLPWQHTFYHCQKKCVLHIYNPRQTSVPNFMRIG